MKNIKKAIALLTVGLFISTTPVLASGSGNLTNGFGGRNGVPHFQVTWEWSNGTGRDTWTIDGVEVSYDTFRSQANAHGFDFESNFNPSGGSFRSFRTEGASTPAQPAVTTPVAPQPAPAVPVQPVAPTAPVVNDSIPEGVAVSNLSNRPEEFANHQMLEIELEVLRLVNEIRAEHGLQPLILDLALSVAARSHSEDLAESTPGQISHYGSTGSTVRERIESVGFAYRSARFNTNENVAGIGAFHLSTTQRAEFVVDNWMDSRAHQAQILSSVRTHIGIGYASGTENNFSVATQKFFVDREV